MFKPEGCIVSAPETERKELAVHKSTASGVMRIPCADGLKPGVRSATIQSLHRKCRSSYGLDAFSQSWHYVASNPQTRWHPPCKLQPPMQRTHVFALKSTDHATVAALANATFRSHTTVSSALMYGSQWYGMSSIPGRYALACSVLQAPTAEALSLTCGVL